MREPLRRAVLGLDFIDFAGEPDWTAPLEVTTAAVQPTDKVRALLSVNALRDSIRTLAIQHDPWAATITRRGFNPLQDYVPIVQHEGYYVLFRQRAEENARTYLHIGKRARDFEREKARAVVALQRMIALCQQKGIELDVVVYPYHAELLLLLDATGLWGAFEDWKRVMTRIVADAAATPGAVPVHLWDFSGFHAYATEPIPPRGNTTTQVRYYWEGGHFKKELGDRVLLRILGDDSGAPPAFGIELRPDTIDGAIAAQRRDLVEYSRSDAKAVAEVREIVRVQCRSWTGSTRPAACTESGSGAMATGSVANLR